MAGAGLRRHHHQEAATLQDVVITAALKDVIAGNLK